MWHACISCSNVFETLEELDKHYSRLTNTVCRRVLVLRNKIKHQPSHKLPAEKVRTIIRHARRRTIEKGPDLEKRTDRNKKEYYCAICSTNFLDEEAHKKTHDVANSTYENVVKNPNNSAQLVHNEDPQIKCPYCDNSLPTTKLLKQHIVIIHRDVVEKLETLRKKIESLVVTSLVDLDRLDEKKDETIDELAIPNTICSTSATAKSPHFFKQEYTIDEIPSWAVQKCDFVFPSQIPLQNSLCGSPSSTIVNSNQVPATVFPLEFDGSPRSTSSSHKENIQLQVETPLELAPLTVLSPTDVQLVNSVDVEPGTQESFPRSKIQPLRHSVAQKIQKKLKVTTPKKSLCHMCFFCTKKFPEEVDYLVHIMHNHTRPKTKDEVAKMDRYIEILSTRLEIESTGSPDGSSRRNSSTDTNLKPNEGDKNDPSQGTSAEPPTKKARLVGKEPEMVVVIPDVGDKIVMDCPACSESVTLSKRISHMEAHLAHFKSETPVCLICGSSAKNSLRLKEHISEHFKVKPFSCTSCWAGFLHRSTLFLHTGKSHKQVSSITRTRRSKSKRKKL